MEQDPVADAVPRYRAFVSYSHADARFAIWLHRKLESSRLPDGTRLAPIFIDRAELAAGPDLSAQVREALSESAVLVVIASPAARASRWVGLEIELFRQLHPGRPVLAALAAGEPDESFPAALLSQEGAAVEPLAADFRKGQDGKRLGLLKIAAGLSAQPLDRLVQRDAQSRQRRVMAVTAGAVILSLVLSALLVVAIRARSEAERQRAEAEGLVEFMLTDLRDKLKGVGRLDVMDTVNERVMDHYASTPPSRLPDDEALRRAKLLQTMGADDLERAGLEPTKSEIRRRAESKLMEAWRQTGSLLRKAPNEPDRVFAHAQSEFYLGRLSLIPPVGKKPDFKAGRKHWEAYLQLAQALVRAEPSSLKWTRELGFAQGALCSLSLQMGGHASKAFAECSAASTSMAKIYRSSPDKLKAGIEYANRLGWEADAAMAAKDSLSAAKIRSKQVELTGQLTTLFPLDARALKSEMLAQLGYAQLLHRLGKLEEARKAAGRAFTLVSQLADLDPANADWQARKQQVSELLIVIDGN